MFKSVTQGRDSFIVSRHPSEAQKSAYKLTKIKQKAKVSDFIKKSVIVYTFFTVFLS